MKKIFLSALVLVFAVVASGQNSSRYEQRYDLLVSQFGPAGVGVETVLDNWAKADSTNAKMLLGRFTYFFTKAQSGVVESRPGKKYLGMEPMLTLKDSLGNDVHYYQINVFDDDIYSQALKAADKAVAVWPDRLDFRFMKANAFIAYEKESPDMALAYLLSLVDENVRRKSSWTYEDEKVDQAFFQDAMQEYCFSFWTIGSETSLEAFRLLSEASLKQFPDNTGFMNNLGSYHLVAKQDYKTALKWYNKVLKVKSNDYNAIKNCITLARKQNNLKHEKKYLQMMVKHGPEKDRILAESRLKTIGK